MSELRIEKRRVSVSVSLTAGHRFTGALFLSAQAAAHAGPERLLDLLNASEGFLPFELVSSVGARETILLNRSHIAVVQSEASHHDLADDTSYQVAPQKSVALLLATGEELSGVLRIDRPSGRNRLSDGLNDHIGFRYLETANGILAVNFAYVVRITPLAE